MPTPLCPLPYSERWSPMFQKQCPEDPTPLPQMSLWWTWTLGLQVQAGLSGRAEGMMAAYWRWCGWGVGGGHSGDSLSPTGGCPTPVRAGFYSWLFVGCCLLWGSVTISIRTHHRIKSWQFHMVKLYEPRVWNARDLDSNLGSTLQVVPQGWIAESALSLTFFIREEEVTGPVLGNVLRTEWYVACWPLGMVPGAQHISICGSQCYS